MSIVYIVYIVINCVYNILVLVYILTFNIYKMYEIAPLCIYVAGNEIICLCFWIRSTTISRIEKSNLWRLTADISQEKRMNQWAV